VNPRRFVVCIDVLLDQRRLRMDREMMTAELSDP
jgi:hypothetical protein